MNSRLDQVEGSLFIAWIMDRMLEKWIYIFFIIIWKIISCRVSMCCFCTIYVKKKSLCGEVHLGIENGFLDEALFMEKIVFKDNCEIHCCCYLVLFRTSYPLKEK